MAAQGLRPGELSRVLDHKLCKFSPTWSTTDMKHEGGNLVPPSLPRKPALHCAYLVSALQDKVMRLGRQNHN